MSTALNCLDENSALDFLSGRLGPPALAETERHLGSCGACVELLARSVPFLPSRHGDDPASSAHRVSPAISTLAMQPPARRAPRPPHTREGDLGDELRSLADLSAQERERDQDRDQDIDGMSRDDSGQHEAPPTLAAGTVLKGTYTVVALIGRGGMGEVYEVAHARLAGRYALKLLPPAFAHEHVSVTRFRREADITSALRHPSIVQVIDFDHTPAGQPFIVMEHLAGGDLAQLMAARGPMPLERVLPIVAQIVSALSAVHRRGIVHRDLKPQNVLLVRDDDLVEDRVKLVDFGLSKRSETSLLGLNVSISRDRTLLGTPRYMAPEQAAGRIDEIDATTDQFALGAMVYEMLTGLSAFTGDHIALLLYRIVSEEPAPLRSILPDLPEHVEQAIQRAMSKQRTDRFPTTNDFFEALSGQPVSAHPGLSSERGARATAVTTPPGSAPISARSLPAPAPSAAGTSGAGVASIDAPVPARGRRRRISAFAVGLGAAILLAVAVPALRARWLIATPATGATGATTPTATTAAANLGEAPDPARPLAAPAIAPAVEAPSPSPPAAQAAPTAAADAPPATDLARGRVRGGPTGRRIRGSKRRDGEPAGQPPAAAPAAAASERPRAAPEPPAVGRLVEEL